MSCQNKQIKIEIKHAYLDPVIWFGNNININVALIRLGSNIHFLFFYSFCTPKGVVSASILAFALPLSRSVVAKETFQQGFL